MKTLFYIAASDAATYFVANEVFQCVVGGPNGPFLSSGIVDRMLFVCGCVAAVQGQTKVTREGRQVVSDEANRQFVESSGVRENQIEELLRLWTAISDWFEGGAYAPYLWEESDTEFPVNNGLRVSGDTFETWVMNSSCTIQRQSDGVFAVSICGARASLEMNHTGDIGRRLVGIGHSAECESLGMPWDSQGDRLFSMTVAAKATHALADAVPSDVANLPSVAEAISALKAALTGAASAAEWVAAEAAQKAAVPPWTGGPSWPSNDDFVAVSES